MALLFAGAGFSYAIDEEKFPTTTEFYENHLPDTVKNSPAYRIIVDHLSKDDNTPIDMSVSHFIGTVSRCGVGSCDLKKDSVGPL